MLRRHVLCYSLSHMTPSFTLSSSSHTFTSVTPYFDFFKSFFLSIINVCVFDPVQATTVCNPAYSYACPRPARISWEGCDRKCTGRKRGIDGGGLLIGLDGVAPTLIVSVFASFYPTSTIK